MQIRKNTDNFQHLCLMFTESDQISLGGKTGTETFVSNLLHCTYSFIAIATGDSADSFFLYPFTTVVRLPATAKGYLRKSFLQKLLFKMVLKGAFLLIRDHFQQSKENILLSGDRKMAVFVFSMLSSSSLAVQILAGRVASG